MNNDKILQSSLLDLLFENRNKAYGAYELRKNYGFRLKKAVFGTIAASMLLFFLLSSFKKEEKPRRNGGETFVPTLTRATPKPDVPVEKPKEKPKGVSSSQAPKNPSYSTPVLVNTTIVPISNPNLASNPTGDPNAPIGNGEPIGVPTGTGTTQVDTTAKVTIVPTVVPQPEVILSSSEAFYKGGKEAFGQYLQDKLGDEAIEDGEAKKITVIFTIDTDGSIINISTEGNKDADFVKKTIQAFSKMKKWQPALQNGQAVRTEKQIPVVIMPEE